MTTCETLTEAMLRAGPFVRAAAPYRLVHVHGPDAEDFLQRLCTQDVKGLAPGHCAPVAFLDPKGKVRVTGIVGKGSDGFRFEVQAHQCGPLVELLDHYHFTEKVIVGVPTLSCLEWVGLTYPPAMQMPDQVARPGEGGFQIAVARRGVRSLRFHAPRPDLPTACIGASTSEEVWEALRMAAGFVKVGIETEPATMALEALLEDHCSVTKGCYTGQETVARTNTYGHINRRLCLLHLGEGPPIQTPLQLVNPDDDLPVGRVLHAVPLLEQKLRVGLGYLPKGFWGVGSRLYCGETTVRVAGFADFYDERLGQGPKGPAPGR